MLQDANAHVTLIALGALLVCCLGWYRCSRRLRRLERNLLDSAEALGQMVEIQMSEHRRISGYMDDIEERILSMSAPEAEPPRPIDRRHQVLALSRKGCDLAEITRRLNIPLGEVELILNLKNYLAGQGSQSAPSSGDMRQHA
ncbi:MAG: hypothetical protein HXY20_07460 [Acidobacteria bacterium]|nr:hypothetical protein [Acidobacteriota bacterium]